MRIETQLAADNNIMHFFAESGFPVKGSVEFSDAKSLRRSPLAENIFDLGGVTSVVITPDCLSVTKEEGALWDDLKPQVLAEIMDFLSRGEAPVREGEETAEDVVQISSACLTPESVRPSAKTAATLFSVVLKTVSSMSNCRANVSAVPIPSEH